MSRHHLSSIFKRKESKLQYNVICVPCHNNIDFRISRLHTHPRRDYGRVYLVLSFLIVYCARKYVLSLQKQWEFAKIGEFSFFLSRLGKMSLVFNVFVYGKNSQDNLKKWQHKFNFNRLPLYNFFTPTWSLEFRTFIFFLQFISIYTAASSKHNHPSFSWNSIDRF